MRVPLALSAALLLAACGLLDPYGVRTQNAGLPDVQAVAALVTVNVHGQESIVCAGTWVADDLVLTAGHCWRPGLRVHSTNTVLDHQPVGSAAKLERFNALHDLALLRVARPARAPAIMRVSQAPRVAYGPGYYAVGHPTNGMAWHVRRVVVTGQGPACYVLGDGSRFCAAWVSGIAKSYYGDSGGPLVDSSGQLVGVMSWAKLDPVAVPNTWFVTASDVRRLCGALCDPAPVCGPDSCPWPGSGLL